MLESIREIKRQFRDVYHFTPSGGTQEEPLFDSIPDGEYPMTISNKKMYVIVNKGGLSLKSKDEKK
jgi:hypothetical protein